MAVPKRKTPSAKRNHRRSHHRVALPQLVACTQCGARHINHRACAVCDTYNGRRVRGSGEPEEE